MNDELQGDSREYKEAARMYNHDLKEYYRQHNYQVMPEEEEENEEIKVIPLRERRNGNPSGYLSALGLKGNEAATVAAQPLRLLKGVDTLSDNKALSRINLSGNKASSSSYPSVRLAQGYGRNTMSDGSFRLAQNDPNKKDPFLDIKEANDFVYRHARSQLYNCIDLLNNYLIYDPDIFRSSYIEGSARCDTAQQQKRYDGRYPEVASDEAFTRCINSGREEEYCNEFKKSMLQCFKDAVEDAEQNGIAYTACGFGAPSKEGIFYKIFKALK